MGIQKFYINDSLCAKALRNCFGYYDLGQLLEEDILKGLTQKVFNMDYFSCKEMLYEYLGDFKKTNRENDFLIVQVYIKLVLQL